MRKWLLHLPTPKRLWKNGYCTHKHHFLMRKRFYKNNLQHLLNKKGFEKMAIVPPNTIYSWEKGFIKTTYNICCTKNTVRKWLSYLPTPFSHDKKRFYKNNLQHLLNKKGCEKMAIVPANTIFWEVLRFPYLLRLLYQLYDCLAGGLRILYCIYCLAVVLLRFLEFCNSWAIMLRFWDFRTSWDFCTSSMIA